MTTLPRSRVASGVPTGGQFAPDAKARSTVNLTDSDSISDPMERGERFHRDVQKMAQMPLADLHLLRSVTREELARAERGVATGQSDVDVAKLQRRDDLVDQATALHQENASSPGNLSAVPVEAIAAEVWRYLGPSLDDVAAERTATNEGDRASCRGRALAGATVTATFLNPHDPETHWQIVAMILKANEHTPGIRVDRQALLDRIENAGLTSTEPVSTALAEQHMREMLDSASQSNQEVSAARPTSTGWNHLAARNTYAMAAASWAAPGGADSVYFHRARNISAAFDGGVKDVDYFTDLARGSL